MLNIPKTIVLAKHINENFIMEEEVKDVIFVFTSLIIILAITQPYLFSFIVQNPKFGARIFTSINTAIEIPAA